MTEVELSDTRVVKDTFGTQPDRCPEGQLCGENNKALLFTDESFWCITY